MIQFTYIQFPHHLLNAQLLKILKLSSPLKSTHKPINFQGPFAGSIQNGDRLGISSEVKTGSGAGQRADGNAFERLKHESTLVLGDT